MPTLMVSHGGLKPAQVARRAGVTVKTLRHYEDYGLLSPERSPKGWRVFDAEQLERLARIRSFRAMGFDLAQIAELLDAPADVVADRLKEHADSLKRRIGELDDALEAVREAQREATVEGEEPTAESEPNKEGGEACVIPMSAGVAAQKGGRGAASGSALAQQQWPLVHRRAA